MIPNYRVGVFRKLADSPGIELTVSYWRDSFLDDTPHVGGNYGFETVAFMPLRCRVNVKDYWFNLDLVKYILRERPDVVVGPLKMFCSNPVLNKLVEDMLALLTGVKFVYRISFGLLPGVKPRVTPSGPRKLWYKLLYRNVVVTAYSQRAAEIARLQGCPAQRILVDYNSMDSDELLAIRHRLARSEDAWKAEFLQRYGIRNGNFVLFSGRVLPQKRLDVLIEAWAIVRRRIPLVQLVVVGSGPAKEAVMHQARDLKGRVLFIEGIYNTEELAKFYYLASIVVFPGYATLSTHFAMCFGKPIITSPYGNEAEYVQDGLNGLIYDYGNPNDLADKLISLLKNPSLRARFGEESLRMVREQINVTHMVNTIANAIRLAAMDCREVDHDAMY